MKLGSLNWGLCRYGALLAFFLLAGCDPARRPPVGQLHVETRPDGGEITCNGLSYGAAPVVISDLPAGEHLLVVHLAGYHELRRTVSLAAGSHRTIRLDLEPLHGLVLVQSDPEAVDVSIDGAHRGQTPLLIPDFPLGTRRLRFEAEGYMPREVELAVEDRVPRRVAVDLVSDAATLAIDTLPLGADVLIDGLRRGRTPLRLERLPRGEVSLELTYPGFKPYQRTLLLRAGEVLELDIPLEPQPGALQVRSMPTGARLYLNDEYQGESPKRIEGLEPGRYRIRAELRGYEPDARTVTIAPAETSSEEFRLRRNSGTLMIVTEPAGVEVFVDGTSYGLTEAAETGEVSRPLRIDYIEQGERVIQLTRPGYRHEPIVVTMEPERMLSLHESMTRLFIPDTVLVLQDGREVTGILVHAHADGTVEIETRPGVILSMEAERIRERRPLRPR